MSAFGEDLIRSLSEALAHSQDKGPAMVHSPTGSREARKQAKLTQADHGRQAPNATTVEAMKELEDGEAQRCDTAEELFRDLDI